jgi:hypothetical protein
LDRQREDGPLTVKGVASEGVKLADSDQPLIFQPDWSQAQIPGTGKYRGQMIKPSKQIPQIPRGLPVSTGDILPGTDIIGDVDRTINENRLDLYRYSTGEEADASTRVVPVITWKPTGSKAICPK